MMINGRQEMLAHLARRGLVVALLAMALICATSGRAQSSVTAASAQDAKPTAAPTVPAQKPAAVAKPAAVHVQTVSPEEKSPAKGTREGIMVHGHWTIDVKNPDGTVASHSDFENTLDGNEGSDLLTGVLSGEYIPLGFTITLLNFSNGTSTGLCGNTGACLLADSRDPQAICTGGTPGRPTPPGSPCGGLLTYVPNKGGTLNNAAGYTLSGTIPNLSNGGTITEVFSGLHACILPSAIVQFPAIGVALGTIGNATTSTALDQTITAGNSCGVPTNNQSPDGSGFFNLTARFVTLPAVTAGQSVAVTVVITFSGS
ncbi:MAG TPA: hypothetical protein VK805_17525 [Candidatus Baltobacteraceae bacterium]|nr:hypothetical protein [Candidatus Baltobacteraceae bacterium]